MKILQFIIPGFILISSFIGVSAQTESLKYTYDASGNRTEKALYIDSVKKSEKASDESSHNEEEEVIEEILDETKISLFPNPTEGSLQVNLENIPEDQQSIISVFDMNGKAILKKTHLSSTNLIDLTHQPSGTYIMIITIGDNTTRWKVMKQ